MEIMERKQGILSEGLIKQSNQYVDEPKDLRIVLTKGQWDIQARTDSTTQLKEQLVAAQQDYKAMMVQQFDMWSEQRQICQTVGSSTLHPSLIPIKRVSLPHPT